MRISIGFHDVVSHVSEARPIAAGHTTLCTIATGQFEEFLSVIGSLPGALTVGLVDQTPNMAARQVFITVDDGALSTFTTIAPALERYGWHGHFFVTTNWIGQPGFLDCFQIRELQRRGHLVGSHSCSHPERMSHLSWQELLHEWSDSCAMLSSLVGQPITTASVPGGYYAPKVAKAAAEAGIRFLFTSEPTAQVTYVDGCAVFGRYSVRRSMSPTKVAEIAAGATFPRWKEAAIWCGKKTAKRVLGNSYIRMRRMLAERFLATETGNEQQTD